MTDDNRDSSTWKRAKLAALMLEGESGGQHVIPLTGRLWEMIKVFLSIQDEIEDEHTCQATAHLGRRGDVKVDIWKKGY